jgi:glyoxylase-like metal-dependent hydrolase (beta-lactamase superfamily II)
MAEVLPGVHQVEGVDPARDFTTHVYLVKDKGSSWTLVDTGLPGADAAVLAYLKKINVPVDAVKSILITHCHRDHVGNLRRMAEVTHAKTYAHWIEAAYIAMDPPYDGPGNPPAEPVNIDRKLTDGETLELGGGLVAYHTPGHTPGHTAYYLPDRRVLFSGDLFMGEGEGSPLGLTVPMYTHHTPTAKISARRVSELKVDAVMSYHGGPVLKGGGEALRRIVKGL